LNSTVDVYSTVHRESAGTFFGALAASSVGDKLGRRYGIIAFLAVFALGVALQTGGTSIGTFVAGRIFAGMGVGGTSTLVPMYQAEVSLTYSLVTPGLLAHSFLADQVAPANIRGALVSSYQLCITIGILIAAVVVNGTVSAVPFFRHVHLY
jgi:SP family sugar:H+ symporter-like MFS transporter